MPLLKFWESNRDEVLSMNLVAIVHMAGATGQLRDGNDTSQEFRRYLREVPSEKLADYAEHCLVNGFTNSGQVLQDIVNEIGRRLAFEVENGLYQGVRNGIGYDGIWRIPNTDRAIVVEVKTTDAYTIKLDTVARYRDRLAEEGRVPRDAPVLLVIGRNDTQSLEAQVRGSRHAWSMRIISIDALVRLMAVNLATTSCEVTDKIHTILQPMEYTRLDGIVDVMFAATEDKAIEAVDSPEPVDEQDDEDKPTRAQERTSRDILSSKKDQAIQALSAKLAKPLIKRKHSMYGDSDDTVHAVVAVSKRYDRTETTYWYAYHDNPQRTFLKQVPTGIMLFAMVDLDVCFAAPAQELEKHWDALYQTVRQDGKIYKHIYIIERLGQYFLKVGNSGEEVDMTPYRLTMSATQHG